MNYFDSALFYVGLSMNCLLVLMALWGLYAFYPRKSTRSNTGASWLILAVWLGFLATALNVTYWRIFGDIALKNGWIDVNTLSFYGRTFSDFIWKGLGCVSIYLHFYARWKSIPKEEQRLWSPLLMGFYPDLTHWAVRMAIRMQALLAIPGNKTKE